MKSISETHNRHQGQTAWIFGKGPGLDDFNMDKAGPLRMCINESVLVVNQPTYFFAHDTSPIQRAIGNWQEGCNAILQPVRAQAAHNHGLPENSIYTYEKRQGDQSVLDWTSDQIAEYGVLYGQSGTVHSAIHFCKLIGATHVNMVGFDGNGGYAKCLELAAGGSHHEKIRQDSIWMLEKLDLDFEFI